MDIAKKSLEQVFYQNFIAVTLLVVCTVVLIICLAAILILKHHTLTKPLNWIIIVGIIVCLSLASILIFIDIRYIKDVEYVNKHDFIQIEGLVLGYALSTSSDDLTVVHSHPIVETTEGRITLDLQNAENRTEIGVRYTFLYLPNTKLAEIVRIP